METIVKGFSFSSWLSAAKAVPSMTTRFAFQSGQAPIDFRYEADRKARLRAK